MAAENPTDIVNLKARRTAILAELAAGGWKPDYSKADQSVQWTAYRTSLYEELESIGKILQQLEGPIVAVSYGRA